MNPQDLAMGLSNCYGIFSSLQELKLPVFLQKAKNGSGFKALGSILCRPTKYSSRMNDLQEPGVSSLVMECSRLMKA